MNNHNIKLFLFLISIAVISCKNSNNEIVLTRGSYKYWVIKNFPGRSKYIEYFDNNGKCLPFVKVFSGSFERYPWGDAIPHKDHWNMPTYNSFKWGTNTYHIIKLTDSIFIIKRPDEMDTLYAAPDSLIPANFRKLQ